MLISQNFSYFGIISKDKDFLESLLIKNEPEKLILVKTGNINNDTLLNLFKLNIENLIVLLEHSSLIEVYSTEIVTHR